MNNVNASMTPNLKVFLKKIKYSIAISSRTINQKKKPAFILIPFPKMENNNDRKFDKFSNWFGSYNFWKIVYAIIKLNVYRIIIAQSSYLI